MKTYSVVIERRIILRETLEVSVNSPDELNDKALEESREHDWGHCQVYHQEDKVLRIEF